MVIVYCASLCIFYNRVLANEASSRIERVHKDGILCFVTRTRFSWSGTINLFLRRSKEVEIESGHAQRRAWAHDQLVYPHYWLPQLHRAYTRLFIPWMNRRGFQARSSVKVLSGAVRNVALLAGIVLLAYVHA